MGYIYSVVAAVAFAVLGVTYKLSSRRGCEQSQVNFFMLSSAAVMVLIWGITSGIRTIPLAAVALGGVDALVIFAGVLFFRRAAAIGRISTSWTILNLSLVMPVVASVFLWREIPSLRHYVGFAMTIAAIALLGIDAARSGE